VPLAVIAILPIEPLELADCKPCEASGVAVRCAVTASRLRPFVTFHS
jgi:hypothetical protein